MRRLLSKIARIGTVFAAAVILCTGCDWIRASLGKPTSADLDALRAEKAAREQAERDSVTAALEREVQEAAARIAAAEAQPQPETLKRYYAVAGAFKDAAGAQTYVDKLQEKGFQVRTFDFKSGLKVICLEGSDSLEAVRRDLATLRGLHLSPSDPWIYNTTKKLHKE